jgi:hypothetical protein
LRTAMDANLEGLPAVDEHVVRSESRYELIDGIVTYVPPSDPPHALRHSKISGLVEAHTHADFHVASDLLMRVSRIDDFAPDVSIYPRASDPLTGGRQIEQLVFEVMNTESVAHVTTKARKLANRGVRRVFAIDVARNRALEWSPGLDTWTVLDPQQAIEDPTLAAPLSVDALLNAANIDDAVQRALIVKGNPVLVEHVRGASAESHAAGLLQGVVRSLLNLLAARGIALRADQRNRIESERDPSRLDTWLIRAASCESAEDLLLDVVDPK